MRPRLIKLTPEYNIKPFDCEDADLNGFLLETDHSISNASHHIKRRSSHPSVKVGRFAISKKSQGQKWGEQILSLLKEWFTHDNKTGCRYITVDALRTAQGFYEKCGFKILVTPEENDETVLMCYDLKQFISE